MTKIGDAFFNMNHVLAVYPTVAKKQPFDFGSPNNYKPTATVVSTLNGKDVVIDLSGRFTDKHSALVEAQEYLTKINFK